MDNIEKAISALSGTEAGSQLEAIHGFFRSVQPDFDDFMKRFGISCPSGCGSCCERFVPDITRSEALYIAAYILCSDRRNGLMDMLQDDKGGSCPFYDRENKERHCAIYPARPLLCRMFLSACSSDKNGRNRFSYCIGYGENRDIPSSEDLKGYRPMPYYGERLRMLEGNSADAILLPEAVMKSISRIGLEMMYSGFLSDNGGESNPA